MTTALEGNKSLHRWQSEKLRRTVILTNKATAVTNEMWWLGAQPFKKRPVVLRGVSGKAIHISKRTSSTAKTSKELEIPTALKISVPIHSLQAQREHGNTNNQAPVSLNFMGSALSIRTAHFSFILTQGCLQSLCHPVYILCVFAHVCVLRCLSTKLSLPHS